MSAGLIKHLKAKTEADANTEILMAQWSFDERIVGKSLENVGSYYPHFSSHNESHSQQILVNIERLLGSNIHKLTATDTWLILEAAYWHDIGMLFSAEEVQGLIKKDEFKDYVESLACDNTQDLHEFAKVWHHEGWQKALTEQSTPHSGVEKYRQMVAEWYRRGHAKNSSSVVMDPFKKLAINSPRTELLPQRIYRYLGQICYAHGRSFEEVMNELPFRQTGMGTEDCHPRFVACLLRLGDLFDIDDNRFCPVMAKQVSNMPALSATHEQKHKAIREFQLDNETVSVTAVCSTEMAYIECRNWFDWIKEEIQNQMSQWKNIVPNREFGLLPTIDKLHVEMDDDKILLDGKPMRFALDEKNVIELLQGNNLYHGIGDVLREIVQNSIDATLLRVWIELSKNMSKKLTLENGNPYSSDVHEILKKYPITLSLEFIEATDEYKNIWKLRIEDLGTGISVEDLKHMQYMGGSDKNIKKKKIINEMPIWMQPSGTFGIGMHSVFLLNKENPERYQYFKFITKSIFNNKFIEIKLNSPLSKDNGYCFINYLDEQDTYHSYGTNTEIFISIERDFSSTKSENKSIEQRKILSEIRDSLTINFPKQLINIVYDNLQNIKRNSILYDSTDAEYYTPSKDIGWFRFRKYSLAIQLYLPDTVCYDPMNYTTTYSFRGQEIHIHRESTHLLNIFNDVQAYIDIYGNAKHFLNVSRNDWKSYDFIEQLFKIVKFEIKKIKFIDSNIRKMIYGFEYNKELGLNIIRKKINSEEIDSIDIEKIKFNNDLCVEEVSKIESFILGSSDATHKVKKSLIRDSLLEDIKIFGKINYIYKNSFVNYLLNNDFKVYKITFSGKLDNYQNADTLLFCKELLFENHNREKALYIDDSNVAIFSLITLDILEKENDKNQLENNYDLIKDIYSYNSTSEINNIYIVSSFHNDQFIHKFKELEIFIPRSYQSAIYYLDDYYREKGILLPFYFNLNEIKLHNLNELYNFVKNQSLDNNLTIGDIERKYNELLFFIKELAVEDPKLNKFFSTNSF